MKSKSQRPQEMSVKIGTMIAVSRLEASVMSHQTDLDKLRNSRGSLPEVLDNK